MIRLTPYTVALVFAVLMAGLSLVGLLSMLAALDQVTRVPADVAVEWSGWIIPFVHTALVLLLSVLAILGLLRGSAAKARLAARMFCFGVPLLILLRWIASSAGLIASPGWIAGLFSALIAMLLLLLGLSFPARRRAVRDRAESAG